MDAEIQQGARCPACGGHFVLTHSPAGFLRKGGATKTITCRWCGKEVALSIPSGHVFKDVWYSIANIENFMKKEQVLVTIAGASSREGSRERPKV
jgi:hypothetical protein